MKVKNLRIRGERMEFILIKNVWTAGEPCKKISKYHIIQKKKKPKNQSPSKAKFKMWKITKQSFKWKTI